MKKAYLTDTGEKEVIVFGCGKWGRRCINDLLKKGCPVIGWCDNDREKWGKKFMDYPIYSTEELQQMKDRISVIIATQHFSQIRKQLQESGINALVYYSHNIYELADNYSVMGCKNPEELYHFLADRYVRLIGTYKHREDFKYIFDSIRIDEEFERDDDKGYTTDDIRENTLDILCEKEEQKIHSDKNYIYAEDLFCVLDEDYIESSGKIPSLMLLKTYNATMQNQKICTRPFYYSVINSVYDFHFCCGDWSDSAGNILENPPDAIWNSSIAKIFRLSLINRTYSFCNANACVHLKPQADTTNERMRDIPRTRDIPHTLEIGIDRTCNLFCKSCRDCVVVETGERKRRTEAAKDVIISSGWLEKCNTLLLGGQGEVFFSNVYQELMFYGSEKRISLDLRTNGTLLTEEYFTKLKKKYKELKIIVSVDAANEATFRKLRRSNNSDSWENLNRNLQMLSEKRKRKELGYFQINMCVQWDNYKEIPDFIRWGEALVVDRVYLTPIRNWGTYSSKEFENVRIFDDNKNLKPEIKELIQSFDYDKSMVEFAFDV
ncbi:hypothetical protein AALB47_04910 [Lachnospiraceae bacterium 54-11]